MADLATAKKSNLRPSNGTTKVGRKSAAFADAAHRVGDAAMMPLSAANNNVIPPATQKLAKSETVVRTRAVLAVAANHVGDAIDKENIMRAGQVNLVRPVAKQINQSETVQKTKKAIGPAAKCMADAAMVPLTATNENVIVPLAQTDTVKKTRKAIVKTAGQVGEVFDKEHLNDYVEKIVPVAKKGAQAAMEQINVAQSMIVQALSHDEQDEIQQASLSKEAPIANTHMVSYAIASYDMRNMLLREEIKEKKREKMNKLRGKRDSSSREGGKGDAAEDTVYDQGSKKKKAKIAPTMTDNPIEPTTVFVPRVVESAPSADLYEAPLRVLACRENSCSDMSELTFGTAGGGRAVEAAANVPLVVARSVDDGDDKTLDLWEC
mmetsp:Transcript_30417/g.66853  ORF Transcript_30417/g.66853 Transcript_30417/m.66853 type:complete len:379 (-) Transcript_30417:196-1332(-)